MKRLILAAILVLALSFSAFGAVQDFGRFSMNILDGWTAQTQDPNVIVTKNDNMAQLVITIASTRGASLEDVAKSIAADDLAASGFKDVTAPVADSDGDWSFTAVNPNGANTHVLVTGADGEFCAFTTTIAQGAEAAGAEIKTMLGTLAVK